MSRMRHFNSPEEIAKREAAGPQAARSKDFRHFNSPEEIAKRQPGSQPRQDIVVRGTDVTESTPPPADLGADGGSLRTRLQRLEALMLVLLRSPEEAREFRRLLNNAGAVEDAQRGINNRVLALEQTVEQLVDAVNGEEPDDDEQPEQQPEQPEQPEQQPEQPEQQPEATPEAPAPGQEPVVGDFDLPFEEGTP